LGKVQEARKDLWMTFFAAHCRVELFGFLV